MDDTRRNGYASTPIGVFPSEWRVVAVGDCFDIQQGKAVSKKARSGLSPYPFLRTANVFWGRVDLRVVDAMDFSDIEVQKLALRPGDLLVCEGGDIGRTTLWDGSIDPCMYQNHLHRLRPKDESSEPLFFMYWMQAAVTHLNLYAGHGNKTTIPNLSKQRLASFLFPLPPLFEQQTIAQVLRTIQRAKEATETTIAAARELKTSLMNHLFRSGNVPYSDAERRELLTTEIGDIPAEWSTDSIGHCATQTQYGLSVRGEKSGEYPILRMSNLADGKVHATDLQYVSIPDRDHERFRLQKGDLLFNRTNSLEHVGRTSLFDLDGDFVFASYLVRVTLDSEQLLPAFLNHYLNLPSTQARLKQQATRAVSQSNINATKLKAFIVPKAPPHEQREIVSQIDIIDEKIAAEMQKCGALGALFNSLLSSLMTGRVRVHDIEGRHSQETVTCQ